MLLSLHLCLWSEYCCTLIWRLAWWSTWLSSAFWLVLRSIVVGIGFWWWHCWTCNNLRLVRVCRLSFLQRRKEMPKETLMVGFFQILDSLLERCLISSVHQPSLNRSCRWSVELLVWVRLHDLMVFIRVVNQILLCWRRFGTRDSVWELILRTF